MNNSKARFQILSISGGGVLGLHAACLLAEFEEQAGKPIRECFDLIAGTSIGGILGIGIAYGVPCGRIRDIIVADARRIFSTDKPSTSILSLRKNACRAKYRSDQLRTTISGLISEDTKIGDLKTPFLTPAVNVTKGLPQVFKTSHHETFVRDYRLKAVDVALATSAAPTFFPLHEINNELFADGGLYANSPDELALHEALHFFNREIEDVHILSIGTTTSKFSFSHQSGKDYGWMKWMQAQRLISTMIAAQQENARYVTKHRLGERYIRVDSDRSPDQDKNLSMDCASESALKDIQSLAEGTFRKWTISPSVIELLKHSAVAPTFYNA